MFEVAEITMSEVAEKFRRIEIELSAEKGNFTLFALIEREDSIGRWDVVISADWIERNEKEALDLVTSKIYSSLEKTEQIMLSKIVILPPSDKFVQNLNLIGVEHGKARITNCTFNGILVKEAFLITSNPKQVSKKSVLKANERPKK
ncbi:MAG: hypothetical protein ACR2MG_16125 [Pyrinomonadaceae bacterium]